MVLDAKRRLRARLDPLLCSLLKRSLMNDNSGFVLCWKPDGLAVDAVLRLRYNVDTAWRGDVTFSPLAGVSLKVVSCASGILPLPTPRC